MFSYKNTLSIIFALIFSFTITAEIFAQNELDDQLSERLEQSLYYGLSSEVSGVVESTLFNMLNYKIVYPEFNSEKVLDRAMQIAEETSSESISSRANLVIYYYQNQDRFPEAETLIAELDYTNQNRIFEFLGNQDHTGQFTSTQK